MGVTLRSPPPAHRGSMVPLGRSTADWPFPRGGAVREILDLPVLSAEPVLVVEVGEVRELGRRGEPQEKDEVGREQGFACAAGAAAKRVLHRKREHHECDESRACKCSTNRGQSQ